MRGSGQQMDEEYRVEMRRGLKTMISSEGRRSTRRNRAIAGGAAAVVLGAAVIAGGFGLARPQLGQDRAQPAPASTTTTPTATAPSPSDSEPQPSAPTGFEGVAAGLPRLIEVQTCADPCDDQGATGSGPGDRLVDAFVLCEGRGTISREGSIWIDCGAHPSGSGFIELNVPAALADHPFTTSADFDGALEVVDAESPPPGDAGGQYATAFVTCDGPRGAVTVGGVAFDCSMAQAPEGEFVSSATIAAWGIPIARGELAPHIERSPLSTFVHVSYSVQR